MCTTSGSGKPANRWSAGMTAGPPASWISRSAPAVSGMALSATRAAGTGQLRVRRASSGRGGVRDPARWTARRPRGHGWRRRCWSRHSETPRPISATPVGHGERPVERLGQHGQRERREAVPTASSAAAQRARTPARNSAMPKSRPPSHVADAGRSSSRSACAPMSPVGAAADGRGEDVVDVARVRCCATVGQDEGGDELDGEHRQVADGEHQVAGEPEDADLADLAQVHAGDAGERQHGHQDLRAARGHAISVVTEVCDVGRRVVDLDADEDGAGGGGAEAGGRGEAVVVMVMSGSLVSVPGGVSGDVQDGRNRRGERHITIVM